MQPQYSAKKQINCSHGCSILVHEDTLLREQLEACSDAHFMACVGPALCILLALQATCGMMARSGSSAFSKQRRTEPANVFSQDATVVQSASPASAGPP